MNKDIAHALSAETIDFLLGEGSVKPAPTPPARHETDRALLSPSALKRETEVYEAHHGLLLDGEVELKLN